MLLFKAIQAVSVSETVPKQWVNKVLAACTLSKNCQSGMESMT